jgi:hypothetical protein
MIALCFTAPVALKFAFARNPSLLSFVIAVVLNFAAATVMYSLMMAVFGHEFYVGQKGGEWAFYIKGVLTWSLWSAFIWLPIMAVRAYVSGKRR